MTLLALLVALYVALSYLARAIVKKLPENTWARGDLYANVTATTWRKAGPPIQKAWIGEQGEPWRYGTGRLVRVLPTVAVNVGRWEPLDMEEDRPNHIGDLPDIKTWKRSLKKVA